MASVVSNTFMKYPENARENIRKLYNLDQPGRLEEAITLLEEWIKKQDHFLKKDFCRGFLECQLYICKGSVEKVKNQLDRHCTMKTLLPKFFTKYNLIPQYKILSDHGYASVLPQMTKDYHRVLLFKFNSAKTFPDLFMNFYEVNIIMTEYVYRRDCFTGIVLIYDARETNYLDIFKNVNIAEFQQFLSIYTSGYKTSLVAIYVLTASKGVDIIVKVLKPMLTAKVASRFHILSAVEQLYDKVPRDILPADYGGCEKPLAELTMDWFNEITSVEHQEYMKSMNQARTDEGLRQVGKFNEEYMGTAGSFRQMVVD